MISNCSRSKIFASGFFLFVVHDFFYFLQNLLETGCSVQLLHDWDFSDQCDSTVHSHTLRTFERPEAEAWACCRSFQSD